MDLSRAPAVDPIFHHRSSHARRSLRRRIAVVTVTSIMFLGCSSEEDTVATPDHEHATLHMDTFTIEPGQQGIKCQTFRNPTGQQMEVAAWQARASAGAHHLHAYIVDEPVEDELHECAQLEFALNPLAYASQEGGDSALEYPAGIAALVEAGQGILLRIHYLNASSEDMTAETSVEIHTAPAGTVERYVSPFTFVNPQIAIPPGQTASVSTSCTLDRDIDIVWAISHMHDHGVGFEATLAEERLYEADSGEAPIRTYTPPWTAKQGDSVDFTCTYVNDTTETLTFGESLSDNEMCNFRGAYAPTTGKTGDRIGCDGGGSCLGCAAALQQQTSEGLCTDDGPPSSKDRYEALYACMCEAAPAGCGAECGEGACAGKAPGAGCATCLQERCAMETQACVAG